MPLNRRQLFAAAPAFLQSNAKPKNILLMIADDLGLHTGAYGDKTARTPNLDRLADEGTLFANAFCTTASCSASRSVILSGLYNHSTGHYGHAHAEHHFGYLPFVKPFPALLRDAGYFTGVLAKLHVNPLESFKWNVNMSNDGGRSVFQMADKFKQFLGRAGSQPWYMHVGFTDPHRAGGGTDFANRAYPGVTASKFDPEKVIVPSFLPDNPAVRKEVAEYYEAANRLDQGIGFFMDALRESGQLDNTLVIFLSDNGMPFANAKTGCYDAGLHLPCVVRAPQQAKRGVRNDAFVNWTDLAPTILDFAGVSGPKDYKLPGRSWLPLLEQTTAAGLDRTFFSHTFHEVTMYYPMRGLRTRQYKYIHNLFPELGFPHASDLYASGTWQSILREGERAKVGQRPVGMYLHRAEEELYDIAKDPDEVLNLSRDPSSVVILKQMREQVRAWRKETKDPWLINDNYR